MRKITIDLPQGYEIRFANRNDIPNIMDFYKIYWKEDHILAQDRAFFEYEFCRGNSVNVVLLIGNDKTIKGTLGYIPYGGEKRDIFTVMWKVIESHDLFLGTALFYYLVEEGNCRHIFTSGLNKGTISIYKYLGFEVVKLTHYYMLNPYEKQNIARISGNVNTYTEKFDKDVLWHMCEEKEFIESYSMPVYENRIQKSVEYILHRYYHNPKYKYDIYKFEKEDKEYYIVFRVQQYKDSKVLRIIDYLGEEFLEEEVVDIVWATMCHERCEYADMYAFGLDQGSLLKAGFSVITETSENIIPNYFAPFVLENIEIIAMYEKGMQPYIFKGDGDQDRAS